MYPVCITHPPRRMRSPLLNARRVFRCILPAPGQLMIRSVRMPRIRILSTSASVQHDETERLKTLLQYEILDTLPDPAFDEIARMAASICNARSEEHTS